MIVFMTLVIRGKEGATIGFGDCCIRFSCKHSLHTFILGKKRRAGSLGPNTRLGMNHEIWQGGYVESTNGLAGEEAYLYALHAVDLEFVGYFLDVRVSFISPQPNLYPFIILLGFSYLGP